MAKVRVVADTNVYVSALLWTGIPHRLLRLAEEGVLNAEPILSDLGEIPMTSPSAGEHLCHNYLKRKSGSKSLTLVLLTLVLTTKINLKKLSDGGVRIAFGTDSGGAADRFFIQGFSEHREMELMVQSGLTPMQVIQSFSKGASETLGIDKDFGTLAKGKAADLLVLEKNPLDNIANMRSIQTIYLGGKKFE